MRRLSAFQTALRYTVQAFALAVSLGCSVVGAHAQSQPKNPYGSEGLNELFSDLYFELGGGVYGTNGGSTNNYTGIGTGGGASFPSTFGNSIPSFVFTGGVYRRVTTSFYAGVKVEVFLPETFSSNGGTNNGISVSSTVTQGVSPAVYGVVGIKPFPAAALTTEEVLQFDPYGEGASVYAGAGVRFTQEKMLLNAPAVIDHFPGSQNFTSPSIVAGVQFPLSPVVSLVVEATDTFAKVGNKAEDVTPASQFYFSQGNIVTVQGGLVFRIGGNEQLPQHPELRVSNVRANVPLPTAPPPAASDIRLKRDITQLALLDNGIALYSFRYFWSDQVYVGVMAQQVAAIAPQAVVMQPNGYLAVYYDRLGLKMQTLEEWQARHSIAAPSDVASP